MPSWQSPNQFYIAHTLSDMYSYFGIKDVLADDPGYWVFRRIIVAPVSTMVARFASGGRDVDSVGSSMPAGAI